MLVSSAMVVAGFVVDDITVLVMDQVRSPCGCYIGKAWKHASNQTIGVVFSLRCRKWLRELPNNVVFLAHGPSKTRREVLLSSAVTHKFNPSYQTHPPFS
jgi:hypothetical protein